MYTQSSSQSNTKHVAASGAAVAAIWVFAGTVMS